MSNLKLVLWSGICIQLSLPAIAQSIPAGQSKPPAASTGASPAPSPNADSPAPTNQPNPQQPTPQRTPNPKTRKTQAKPSTPAPKYLQDVCTPSSLQCVRVQTGTVIPIGAPFAFVSNDCQKLLAKSRPAASASTISQLLTNVPKPFSVSATGSTVTIYSTRSTLSTKDKDPDNLSQLELEVGRLIALGGFQVDIRIPHASTLGSMPGSLSSDAPSGLTVTAAGSDSLRLTSDGSVTCSVLTHFLDDVARFAGHTSPDTPIASVFFVDPAATASTLGATAIPFALGGASAPAAVALASGAPPTSGNSPSGNGGGNGGSPGGNGGGAPGGNGGSPGSAATPASTSPSPSLAGSSPTATITITQGSSNSASPSSTTTPATTPSANSASGSPSAAGAANGTPPSITVAVGSSPSTPPASSSPSPASSSQGGGGSAATYSVNGRDLYFPESTPGDDAAVTEKKRIVALLDLPQPQVLVNAWIMQSSTSKAADVGTLTTLLRGTVNEYDDNIQRSLNNAWLVLRSRTLATGYFDGSFHDYLTLRTVLNGVDPGLPPPDALSAVLTQEAGEDDATAAYRAAAGLCPADQYCLGYTTLFDPVQPRLTDMLITLIAARDPATEANCAVNAMEFRYPLPDNSCNPPGLGSLPPLTRAEHQDKATIWDDLGLPREVTWDAASCQLKDQLFLFEDRNRFPVECVRQVMQALNNPWTGLAWGVGPVRSALADFLFNYKFSQQFPHEFTPYDLTMSAQALDSALAPFIHAFNEDLQAYQAYMRASWIAETGSKRISGDKNTFLNDGIVTVQTTSGDLATVQTGTNSFLNTSRAPTVNELFQSILQSSSSPTGVAANLSANEAQVLMGALAAYQTTYLNVTRQLNLVVRPRSLLGASAAEMDVQLDADQGATSPNYWTSGSTSSANVSQVTQHDTATHVRVDSIRLFEVSSFSAVLSKGRDKFPVLPPFVEIPYIGTLAGVPLKAAREFHTSSAIVSAVIVPTATDIAYSLRFTGDYVISGVDRTANLCRWPVYVGAPEDGELKACKVRKALSYADLREPVREFHRMKLHCLATLDRSPVTSAAGIVPPASGMPVCNGLGFASVLREDTSN